MTDEEAVAIAMALDALALRHPSTGSGQGDSTKATPSLSRWKVADRKPDLEIEELRAIH